MLSQRNLITGCFALAALTAAVIAFHQSQAGGAPFYPDFMASWDIGSFAQRMPDLVYDPRAATPIGPWTYPPSFLLIIIPFSLLPAWIAYFIWVASSLGVYLFAASRVTERDGIVSYALLICAAPVWHCFLFGQSTPLVAAMTIAALVLLDRNPLAAGAFIAAAGMIKPQVMLLAPLALVADRKYAAIISAAWTTAAIGIVTSVLFGPKIWLDWVRAVPRFMAFQHQVGQTQASPSFYLDFPGDIALRVTLVAIACAGIWVVFKRTAELAPRLTALLGGSMLCSPYVPIYEMALLAPAAVSFISGKWESDWERWRAVAAAVALYVIPLAMIAMPALFLLNVLAIIR